MKMHADPEKAAHAIASLASKLGIRSEIGKVLFGLECLLTLIVLVAFAIFSTHDLIMAILNHPGEQALAAFMWGLLGVLASMLLVIVREWVVGKFPNVH